MPMPGLGCQDEGSGARANTVRGLACQ